MLCHCLMLHYSKLPPTRTRTCTRMAGTLEHWHMAYHDTIPFLFSFNQKARRNPNATYYPTKIKSYIHSLVKKWIFFLQNQCHKSLTMNAMQYSTIQYSMTGVFFFLHKVIWMKAKSKKQRLTSTHRWVRGKLYASFLLCVCYALMCICLFYALIYFVGVSIIFMM